MEQQVLSLFKKEAETNDANVLRALIIKLTGIAHEAEQRADHIEQYVLLKMSSGFAVTLGDPKLALDLHSKLTSRFEIDPLELRVRLLKEFRKSLSTTEGIGELFLDTRVLIKKAIQKDQYKSADQLSNASYALAKRTGLKTWSDSFRSINKQISAAQKKHKEVQRNMAVLEVAPNNPTANRAAGEYYCLEKQRWDVGLEYFKKCDDAELRKLAQTELDLPASVEEKLLLADRWWNYSEDFNYRSHAKMLYQELLPNLQGLEKTRVESRINQPLKNANKSEIDIADFLNRAGTITWKDASGKVWENSIRINADGTYERWTQKSKVHCEWTFDGNRIIGKATNKSNVVDYIELNSDATFRIQSRNNNRISAKGTGHFE